MMPCALSPVNSEALHCMKWEKCQWYNTCSHFKKKFQKINSYTCLTCCSQLGWVVTVVYAVQSEYILHYFEQALTHNPRITALTSKHTITLCGCWWIFKAIAKIFVRNRSELTETEFALCCVMVWMDWRWSRSLARSVPKPRRYLDWSSPRSSRRVAMRRTCSGMSPLKSGDASREKHLRSEQTPHQVIWLLVNFLPITSTVTPSTSLVLQSEHPTPDTGIAGLVMHQSLFPPQWRSNAWQSRRPIRFCAICFCCNCTFTRYWRKQWWWSGCSQ